MTGKDDNTLLEAFSAMDASERPGPWSSQPAQDGLVLGKRWKGTYAYLEREEIPVLRALSPGAAIFMDKNVEQGESAIQVLVCEG